ALGFHVKAAHLDLLLPVGISFYTFHTMSYVIDVYRGVLPACHDPVDFALFVSFFPQLVAGPIARAQQLLPQMEQPRRVLPEQFVAGLFLIAQGLFKKVVVGDGCGRVVNAVFGHDADFGGLDKLVAVYAFAWEIYGDFSGYSDMARGLAKLMGFELMVNFDLPYFSTNPSEFWRRWHISLSSWLRDYLYIPLGGNRGGPFFNYRNLFLTMLIGGIWHGASWTMALWGAYQGLCLVAHRLIAGRGGGAPPDAMPAFRRVVQTALMFQVTCLGWLIFRAQDVGQVGRFLRDIAFDLRPTAFTASYARLTAELALPLWAYELVLFRGRDLEPFAAWAPSRKAAFALGLAAAAGYFVVFHRSLVQGDVPFIYFQF
ncbi:MAG TPA: MBOAT family O-acyltransferase, partial [Polyangiaceae bacterium]|nr:MBOAT family O-acyltransferase [Polyangiaceae bacterium]